VAKPQYATRQYRRERAYQAKQVARDKAICCECGQPIYPGERWHLAHEHDGTDALRGPAHAICNLRERNARVGVFGKPGKRAPKVYDLRTREDLLHEISDHYRMVSR
jgi:hypothetical protein